LALRSARLNDLQEDSGVSCRQQCPNRISSRREKTPLKWIDVRNIIRDVDEIYIAKGKRIIHVQLNPSKHEPDLLARLLLRPSGNLRAPTFR